MDKDKAEAMTQGAELILNLLFDSLQKGHSIGRIVEEFRAKVGPVPALYQRLQEAGLLTINNIVFDAYELYEQKK